MKVPTKKGKRGGVLTKACLADITMVKCCADFPTSHWHYDVAILIALICFFYFCNATTVWSLSKKWMTIHSSIDARALLSHECDVCGIRIKPSIIAHSRVGITFFAVFVFVKRKLVGLQYGTLIYKTIPIAPYAQGINKKGVLSVSFERYAASANCLTKIVSFADGKSYKIWFVPARFSWFQFVDYPRFFQ